jgi:hypothetical protein
MFGKVMLARLFGVMCGVNVMPLRHLRMVTGFVVVTGLMVLGRGFVMRCGVFVMFGSLAVMFRSFFRHGCLRVG